MASNGTGRTRDDLPEHRRRIYARDTCHDYDDLIERSFTTGKALGLSRWPDGTPVAGEADAWRLLGKIANCRAGRQYTIRRGQPDGLGPRQRPDGTWEAWFAARPKAHGRDYITARIEAGDLIAFNPAQPKAHGRYICRKYLGGCGHRRATQPETLCRDCAATAAERQATETAAEERQHREQLARRHWGQDWDDLENWRVDHAMAPPRTPQEQADRPRSEQARQHIGLEQRERRRGESWLPWEERPPRHSRAGLARQARQARQAVADHIEASRIDDPALREMLDRWRANR